MSDTSWSDDYEEDEGRVDNRTPADSNVEKIKEEELSVEVQKALTAERQGQFHMAYHADTPERLEFLQKIYDLPSDREVPMMLQQHCMTYGSLIGFPEIVNHSKALSWDLFDICFSRYEEHPKEWEGITTVLATSGLVQKMLNTLKKKEFQIYFEKVSLDDWIQFNSGYMVKLLRAYKPEKGRFPNYYEHNEKMICCEYYESHIDKRAKYNWEQGYRGCVFAEDMRNPDDTSTADVFDRIPSTHHPSAEESYLATEEAARGSNMLKYMYLCRKRGNLAISAIMYARIVMPFMERSDAFRDRVSDMFDQMIEQNIDFKDLTNMMEAAQKKEDAEMKAELSEDALDLTETDSSKQTSDKEREVS